MPLVQRNLLLITFDQARGDWCNPETNFVDLSALKLLSNHGYKYERCYTTSPQCVPARLSWLTGKMPSTVGITKNMRCSTKKTMPSIFKKLSRSGWHVEIIGKTHWTSHTQGADLRENHDLMNALGINRIKEIGGPRAMKIIKCELTELWEREGVDMLYQTDMNERYGEGRKVNSWLPRPTCLSNSLYPDIWIANEAIKAIKCLPHQKPWILWVSFVGPHEPFDTPEDWKGKVSEDKIPEPLSNATWIDKLDESIELRKNRQKWQNTFTAQECTKFRIDYANNLKLLDDQIWKILNTNIDHNKTDIVVTSDHGEMLGDYNMLYKSTFLEPAIRVPMIISNLANKCNSGKNIKAVTNSTRIIRNLLRMYYRGDRIDKTIRDSCKRSSTTVEFANERCFIRDNKKLITDQSGNILWGSNIKKNSIKEIYIDAISIEKSQDGEWKEIKKWSKTRNNKLESRKNKYARHLDIF